MRYNIKECKIYGIKSPFLFFSGWVESEATKLVIKDGNEVFYELIFNKTKSKTHAFSIRTPLSDKKIIDRYKILIYDQNNNVEIICEFKSTPIDRIIQKFRPDKYAKFKDKHLGKYKAVFDETIDLKDNKGYRVWIDKYEKFNPVINYDYKPLISIIIPVYNVADKYLSLCLDSILNQTYQNFEICLADDCSTNQETIDCLHKYMKKDSRVKVLFREKNGHISEASNSALSLAKGDYIGMMDNDDLLMPQALNEVVKVINEHNDADFIYTDEDKIDLDGNRSDPQFKPDFAIDKLYGGNYICHFNVIRKSIMDEVGGFRKGYEGAQDFDLFIRIAELTDKFYHIPKVLYHWRMITGSTALDAGSKNYAGEAGKRALEDLFEKKGIDVQISIVVNTHYFVEYILETEPKIEIVMNVSNPTLNLINRLQHMMKNLSYHNYSFVFITQELKYLGELLEDSEIPYSIIPYKTSLSCSINDYIRSSNAEHMIYLDENAVFDTFDAIDVMVGYSSQKEMGMIGAKIINNKGFVVDSGYFLIDHKLLPVHYATYYVDYGYYGNLLVHNNYEIIENTCFMININLLKDIKGFNTSLNDENIFYDLCIRLFRLGKRNVILPKIEVCSLKEDTKKDMVDLPLTEWKRMGINTEYDMFYNVNLSSKIAFRLDE